MAEIVKMKIPSSVAAHIKAGLSVEEKLKSIEGAPAMETLDGIILLFCLMKDSDSVVKDAANTAFASLPEEMVLAAAGSTDIHPALLDAVAKMHYRRSRITEALLQNEIISEPARSFLQNVVAKKRQAEEQKTASVSPEAGDMPSPSPAVSERLDENEAEDEYEECEESDSAVDEESEEFLSKYQMVQVMGIAEKIKMALTGDKEWRAILCKDANKLVSGGVIKNPRITEAEVLNMLKSGIQNDEIMRLICANKEWVKNYQIRKALVLNHRTPVQNALRYLATLNEKDIAGLAKSKNVSSVISTQARRTLLNKKR